jgi:DNA-binding IclR family transcriptional regulator
VLARRLDQSLSTTYYALQALTDAGVVEPSPKTPGLYTLGPQIADLYRGYVANRTRPERLAPVLQALRDETRARTYLAWWSQGDLEIADTMGRRGAAELRDVSAGYRGTAHALALGKVILASIGYDRWPDYLRQPRLRAFTEHTISTPDRLRREVLRMREAGYATDMEEFELGVSCVAAPVRDSAGRVIAGLGLSVSSRRFLDERDGLEFAVKRAAQAATQMYVELDPLTAMVCERARA